MSAQNNRQPNQALCMLICNKIRHYFETDMRKLVSFDTLLVSIPQ